MTAAVYFRSMAVLSENNESLYDTARLKLIYVCENRNKFINMQYQEEMAISQ
jgi:hypothetical protein